MTGPKPTIGQIAAAIFLPPLAVYLARGLGASFWIGVALTVFWWVPGIIYALAILFVPNRLLPRTA